ncbi:tripartite tricarboxylate transporter TctB family protein [Desulforhopalus singaporensis]|uniref:Tripartite tricarboxylate transporter TctB family protein n=1 Tax=Desulforhopalus singaporensis TaxID=91360 RepID=A0A1H0PJP4_9BACT|nr:tripartite tricarboxylate transporter TctB family protein [Desulforhopalus singaporensis]SDP05233.1 Tripartite tricarboxylate transporter TctB family protein [Desulforhopalus singaporensis]
MNRRKIDVILSAALITVSLIILTNDKLVEGGMETELGSMFVPRLIAVFILIFSGTIGIQSLVKLKKREKLTIHEHINTTGFGGVGIYFSIFILYWLASPHLGFLVATPFVILAIAYLLGGRNWILIGIMSVIVPILIYYGCSQYLRVFLPTWSLS